jgi:uracil-DNA glycosylase
MRTDEAIACVNLPCADVNHAGYVVPDAEVNSDDVVMVMISEAAPQNASDFYYAGGESLFEQTTVQAFNDAGVSVSSIRELLDRGIYFTTAVKCAKVEYGIKANTINECSVLLERELALFPNAKVLMLMGDVAIKAVNRIARSAGGKRVIPAGSTYKIRGEEYFFQGKRVFPSYVQAGPSFFIEKSKRRMISEDIAAAMEIIS